MPSLTLNISYQKNTGLVYSSTELSNLFFFGIPFVDFQGNPIPPETIYEYLESAQTQIENYLSVKFTRQSLMENPDYTYDDWRAWGYLQTNYPAERATSLQGYVNTSLQLTYPSEWLSTKRQTEKDIYHRNISLVPVSGSIGSISGSSQWVGIVPYIGWFGCKLVPNYWELIYITGFDRIPADLRELVGKLASISLFTILSDSVIGIGLQSKSQSIDGLSQSVSARSFKDRIAQYEKDVERLKSSAKMRYTGFVFGVA